MMFWIVCAVLTAAAFFAVLLPYLRSKSAIEPAQVSDIAVYKDQLTEIEADLARGLILPADAENARLEVSRRLLKADEASRVSTGVNRKIATFAASAALLSIPLISWGGYAMLGSPQMPDLPITSRADDTGAMKELAGLLEKAEAHLKAEPKDGRGWSVIAPIFLRMGRYAEAVNAYQNAIANSTPTAALHLGLGQALASQNNGQINEPALKAFQAAADLEPANPEPKALLAAALAQQGKFAEAKVAFTALLAETPADAPWRANIETALREIDVAMNPASAPAMKGPTQSDVENAASMSEEDRKAMIEGMVAKLDARLAESPDDLEGWQRLIRSYAMLKDPEKAKSALQRARTALAANGQALAQINAAAQELGLEQP